MGNIGVAEFLEDTKNDAFGTCEVFLINDTHGFEPVSLQLEMFPVQWLLSIIETLGLDLLSTPGFI